MNGVRVVEPVAMLEKMVKTQLRVEHSYFLLNDMNDINISTPKQQHPSYT